jgi:hypothetical protein
MPDKPHLQKQPAGHICLVEPILLIHIKGNQGKGFYSCLDDMGLLFMLAAKIITILKYYYCKNSYTAKQIWCLAFDIHF